LLSGSYNGQYIEPCYNDSLQAGLTRFARLDSDLSM
jgi:hypothetical protein